MFCTSIEMNPNIVPLLKAGSLFSALLHLFYHSIHFILSPCLGFAPLCVWSFLFSWLIFREICALFLRMAKPGGSNVSSALSTWPLPAAPVSLCLMQSGIIFFLSWQIPGWKSTIWLPGNRSAPLFYWTWIPKGQPQEAQEGPALSLHWGTASAIISHTRYLVRMLVM